MILVINSGSSTIKFAVYQYGASLALYCRGHIDDIGGSAKLWIEDHNEVQLINQSIDVACHLQALTIIFQQLEQLHCDKQIVAVGHRVVHGGIKFSQSVIVNKTIIAELDKLIPLASLHQANNLAAIKMIAKLRPDLPQIACFDTAFHQTMPQVEQQIALDKTLLGDDIKRYGFHGLSYQSIANKLPKYLLAPLKDERVVVAHLGAGASLCAMKNRQSVATTMSFSPLDGVAMATRCGSIDPEVLLYLQQQKNISLAQLSDSLNHHSGLKAISGLSGDMQELLASDSPQAKFAVEYFVYHITRHLGAMVATLGGIDALVFTAGIGEHAAEIREKVCQKLHWLGLSLDLDANQQGRHQINDKASRVSVWNIATDEEQLIAEHSLILLKTKGMSSDGR